MALAVGVHAVFADPIADVDRVVALLIDPRWPFAPQLLRASSVPGGALTPQVKGKLPMAERGAALTAALAAPTTSSIVLSSSRQEAGNHAWIALDTGRHRVGRAACPFDLRIYCRVPPAGLGAWIEVVHGLVAAVGAQHGVIVASDRERALECEVWLQTASVDGRPVHPDPDELRRVGRARAELGAQIRPPRWGTYLGPAHVAAAGGRAHLVDVVAPPVIAEVDGLLYVQLSASVTDALAPATEVRRRALAELLRAVTV